MASVRGAPLMTDDLAAFLVAAEALAVKHALGPTFDEVTEESVDTGEHCGRCGGVWPCDTARLRPLAGMVRAVLARHHPETNALAGQPWCYECSTPARALLGKTDWSAMVRGDQDIPWPCATVAALLSAIPPTPTAENISTILARESAEAERTWAAEERGEQEPPRLYRANPPTPTAEETR